MAQKIAFIDPLKVAKSSLRERTIWSVVASHYPGKIYGIQIPRLHSKKYYLFP